MSSSQDPPESGDPGDSTASGDSEGGPSGPIGWVRWFMNTDDGIAAYIRDVLTSAGAVALVALLLFGVSGIWPPMVAVESPSMTPHLQTGDLVFVVEEHRFTSEAAYGTTGIVPTNIAAAVGHEEFRQPGDVIVYQPDGDARRTPIIHRARFWVNESENWYDKANPEYLAGADNCQELSHCPADHGGFITKGDANPQYDQVGEPMAISSPVEPQWIIGTAEFRVPWLGWVRLAFAEVSAGMPPPAASAAPANGSVGIAG